MRRVFVRFLFLLAGYAIFVVVMRLAFPLPPLAERTVSVSIPISGATLLGQSAQENSNRPAGKSGFITLDSGLDAFAARVLLARGAEQSIDARYYIWQDDMTGTVLLDALRQAALRGVRVRLLVDDNGIPGLDDTLAALDGLPHMEVRIFNPFQIRSPKFLPFLFDFPRLNRRMHNKSFSVDGAFSVVGGRNVGDIYFESGSHGVYFDLDVLTIGPTVDDVAEDFDRYWSSPSAYPANLLINLDDPEAARAAFAQKTADILKSEAFRGYATALLSSEMVQNIKARALPYVWAEAQLFSDDPAKGLGRLAASELLISRLFRSMPQPDRSFDLLSAYFIPGRPGTDYLTSIAERGVAVRTMTNGFEATDVVSVHSGYAKYRDNLLAAGIKVYELKSQVEGRQVVDSFGVLGSATSSLHAKAFSVDGQRIFIGSFNFDPRSAALNCEMGFLIESPEMAVGFSQQLSRIGVEAAYRVESTPGGGLVWHGQSADGSITRTMTEPGSTWFSRVFVTVLGWLPIEWML